MFTGLAGEKVRWEETVSILEEKIGYLVGDCLVASAFMSYMGPFLSNYRDELTKIKWLEEVSHTGLARVPSLPTIPANLVLAS